MTSTVGWIKIFSKILKTNDWHVVKMQCASIFSKSWDFLQQILQPTRLSMAYFENYEEGVKENLTSKPRSPNIFIYYYTFLWEKRRCSRQLYAPNRSFHIRFLYIWGTENRKLNCFNFDMSRGFSFNKISMDFFSSTLLKPTFS